MKKIIYLFIVLIMVTSCEEGADYETINIPVVEGYLYPNKKIDNIKISNVINYGADGIIDMLEISEVQITVDEEIYLLKNLNSDSSVVYAGDSTLIVEPGKEYKFSFMYGGEIVYASTKALSKPSGYSISKSRIYIDRMDGTSMPNFDIEEIDISWNNPDDEYFYLSLQYIENTPDPVNPDFDIEPENMNIQPQITDAYNFKSKMFMFFGTYRIVLFKVTDEYANLYENIENNSMSLTEPFTNIENGKGIFTSIASDTLYFEVSEAK